MIPEEPILWWEELKRMLEKVPEDNHWVLPKAHIAHLESLGYVTLKDGKKWALGGWLHEDVPMSETPTKP